MATDKTSDEMTKVKEDLAKLREDLGALAKLYKDNLQNQAEGFASRARDSAQRVASEAGTRVREGSAAVSEQIEARPLTSVLVAFAVGLTVGKLLDRR